MKWEKKKKWNPIPLRELWNGKHSLTLGIPFSGWEVSWDRLGGSEKRAWFGFREQAWRAWHVIQATTGSAHRMEAASSIRAVLSTCAQREGRGPIIAASLQCPHGGCYSTATSSGNSQAQVGGMTAGQKSKVTPGDPTVAAGALHQQTHTGRSGGAVLGGQPSWLLAVAPEAEVDPSAGCTGWVPASGGRRCHREHVLGQLLGRGAHLLPSGVL